MNAGRAMAEPTARVPKDGEKLTITVEGSSRGALLVCLEYCSRIYRGALLDCTKGVFPACIFRPKSSEKEEAVQEKGTAILSHMDESLAGPTATQLRYTYKPESEYAQNNTTSSITAAYRRSHKNQYVRNRMLRPRQTMCSKCQSHVLSEDVSDVAVSDLNKKRKMSLEELESANKRLRRNVSPVIKISFNSPNGQNVVEISSKTMINPLQPSAEDITPPRKKKKSKDKHKHRKKNKRKHRRDELNGNDGASPPQQLPCTAAGEACVTPMQYGHVADSLQTVAPSPPLLAYCAGEPPASVGFEQTFSTDCFEHSDDGSSCSPPLTAGVACPIEDGALDERLVMRVHTRSVSKYVHGDGRAIRVGDVVWGKITGFPWWPGRVTTITVSENDASVVIAYTAHVAWFASKTSSNIACSDLYPFAEHFATRFNRKKKGPYKNAVKQAKLAVLNGAPAGTAAIGSFDEDDGDQDAMGDDCIGSY